MGHFWRTLRDFWKTGKAGFVLFLISLCVLIYSYIAIDYERIQTWKGHASVQNVIKDISAFIPVGMAFVAMIVGGIDIIMLLSDWFLERREKRIQAAKEEGRKEGYAEGYAAAKAENGTPERAADAPRTTLSETSEKKSEPS